MPAIGERLYDVWPEFLHFVGGRPLVGYFLEFDVAMIDRNVLRFIGIELPNVKRETVYLRELLNAKEATGSTAKLP